MDALQPISADDGEGKNIPGGEERQFVEGKGETTVFDMDQKLSAY